MYVCVCVCAYLSIYRALALNAGGVGASVDVLGPFSFCTASLCALGPSSFVTAFPSSLEEIIRLCTVYMLYMYGVYDMYDV